MKKTKKNPQEDKVCQRLHKVCNQEYNGA